MDFYFISESLSGFMKKIHGYWMLPNDDIPPIRIRAMVRSIVPVAAELRH